MRSSFIKSAPSPLSDIIDLNVKSTVLLTRLLAPRIARRGSGGRIMIIGSLASVGPGPDVAVYAATKAFLHSFASVRSFSHIEHFVVLYLCVF
jgi:short-subunit dehydrogenase